MPAIIRHEYSDVPNLPRAVFWFPSYQSFGCAKHEMTTRMSSKELIWSGGASLVNIHCCFWIGEDVVGSLRRSHSFPFCFWKLFVELLIGLS